METAGVVLAIPGVVDLCLRYGTQFIYRCKDYAAAERQIHQTILRIESIWFAMHAQIELIRMHWNELPDDLQIHMNSVLAVLQIKIQTALANVDRLIGSRGTQFRLDNIRGKQGEVKKMRYASLGKRSLEDIVADLEKWQKTLDNSWFMIAMVRSSPLEMTISNAVPEKSPVVAQMQSIKAAQQGTAPAATQPSSIFIDPADITEVSDSGILYSEVQVALHTSTGQRVLIDQAPRSMTKPKVRDLARKFAGMDPSITNLLACRGVLEIQNPHDSPPEFQLIFSIPSGSTNIQTLRSVLLTANPNHSLTSRIHLATSLARSVIFLHEARFVHKNIRPETILLFSSAGGERTATLGTPHLVGLEELRDDDAGTSMRGDGRRGRNLYRHPQRQGLAPQQRYTVRHDVYSLGVCLLEIGLWRSLVAYDDDAAAAAEAGAGSTPAVRPEWAGVRPFELKRRLVEVAGAELPGRVGEVYAGVVVACLTCLDADSETFGDLQGLADEDGIIVGVRYIEKILEKIEQIVV